MSGANQTLIRDFTLVGLSEDPEIKYILFVVFFLIYITTLIGNISIILVYNFSPNLHNPMYFFLSSFSFLEICYVSSTTPQMLVNFLLEIQTITYYGCAVQMYCVLLLGATEFYILAAMAYDRYNAICHPLLYTIIMSKKVCMQLIAWSWVIGAASAIVHTAFTFSLPFCRSHKINSFFCDVPALLKLSCKDTWLNELIVFTVGGGIIVTPLILTVISYLKITSTILNIHSSSGRQKAFSTCSSHLIVVAIFYGSLIFVYLTPKSNSGKNEDKIISVVYTIIAPLLNPFIYSLRNKEVKIAMKKILSRMVAPLTH
ncbi:olfactory receptor 5I1-like [Dendropsophus ebraccatus]|uniref:olfactory receptor 5I1-like n=1 Tax=Dendropsophus ebraccatus TaxID=150705 RepID=UPI0038317C2F